MEEPNYLWQNIISVAIPFAAYFSGIFIRQLAWPSRRQTPLKHQCLLGIPVSLVLVSPLLPVLNGASGHLSGYLLTLGIIMEHGMLVTETATHHVTNHLRSMNQPSASLPEGAA